MAAVQDLRRATRQFTKANVRAGNQAPGSAEALQTATANLQQAIAAAEARKSRRETAGKSTGRVTGALNVAQGLADAPVGSPMQPFRSPTSIQTATEPAPVAASPVATSPAASTPTLPAAPTPSPAATAPPVTPTFTEALSTQFGTGNPFGMGVSNVGTTAAALGAPGSAFEPSAMWADPIQTAYDRAQELLGRNIAALTSTLSPSGMAGSSRAALLKGAATGEAATGLGDILAQRGLEARSADLNRLLQAVGLQAGTEQSEASRGLSALLGAGQLDIGQQAANQQALSTIMNALAGYGGLGTGITGIGAQEQVPPLLQAIQNALSAFGASQGAARTGGETTSGYWL